MRNLFSFFIIFLIFSCSGTGLEGFVNEPITITALDPEDGQDYDYFWSVENQPDGSLIGSRDLKTSNGGKEMLFTPDYPGDYSIELIISKYGDEIDVQKFLFTILDEKITSKKNDGQNTEEKDDNEDWLDDEYEDDEYEDDEYEDDEYEDDEYEDESDTKSKKNANQNIVTSPNRSNVQKQKNTNSIAAKTDRYTIQITSKRKLKDAQIYSKSLIKNGYDVYIQKIVLENNGTWYRVRLGSYNDYNAAKKDAKLISAKLGFTVWVDFVRKE